MPPDLRQLYDDHAPSLFAFRAAFTEAFAELTAEQRTVVHLKLWEQMTFAKGGIDPQLSVTKQKDWVWRYPAR